MTQPPNVVLLVLILLLLILILDIVIGNGRPFFYSHYIFIFNYAV